MPKSIKKLKKKPGINSKKKIFESIKEEYRKKLRVIYFTKYKYLR